MSNWKAKAEATAKIIAKCTEMALRFSSRLLTKLADEVHRRAQA